MRLDHIRLQNFRGFESFEMDMAPGNVTVIIGANGSGKTSLLRAAAMGIEASLEPFGIRPASNFNPREDVRVTLIRRPNRTINKEPQLPLQLEIDLEHSLKTRGNQNRLRVRMEVTGADSKPSLFPLNAPRLVEAASLVRSTTEDLTLPIFAYAHPKRKANAPIAGKPSLDSSMSRIAGYSTARELGGSINNVFQWMINEHYVLLERSRNEADKTDAELHPQLHAVQRGSAGLVEGAKDVFFSLDLRELVVELADVVQTFNTFSDGYRSLIATGMSLVWQSVVLNPHLGADAPAETPGVVLIDEVELHLHPAWQWKLLERLQQVFPKVQFIVTTHSPTIVSAAPADSVRLLRADGPPLAGNAAGRDVNGVLEEVFGTRARPPETAKKLRALDEHLVAKRNDEARRLLAELEKLLAHDDPELIRARWTLRLRERTSGSASEG